MVLKQKASVVSDDSVCFGVIADDSVGPQLTRKAVTSMGIELARIVSSEIGNGSQDLRNIKTRALRNKSEGVALMSKCMGAGKLKVEVLCHLIESGHVTVAAVPRNILQKVARAALDVRSRTTRAGMESLGGVVPRNILEKVPRAALDARSRTTPAGTERFGGAVMALDVQVQSVRSESAFSRSGAFTGESVIIPPQCVGRVIGRGGQHILRLERELEVKVSFVPKGCGWKCLRLEAATLGGMLVARRLLVADVSRYLELA